MNPKQNQDANEMTHRCERGSRQKTQLPRAPSTPKEDLCIEVALQGRCNFRGRKVGSCIAASKAAVQLEYWQQSHELCFFRVPWWSSS